MLYFIVILIFLLLCIGFTSTLNIFTFIISGGLILLGIKCLRASKGTDNSLAKAGSWMFIIFGIFILIIRFTAF